MNDHVSPSVLDSKKPQIQEIKILEVQCPNPDCNQKLDITNINEGTKIKCPQCHNITWTPSYKQKWWHRGIIFIVSLFISFIIGVLSSITATKIIDTINSNKQNNQQKVEKASDT